MRWAVEDLKWLATKLPERVSGELEEWIMGTVYDEGELGENLILYSRESVEWTPAYERTMDDAAWERRRAATRRSWGARCTCLRCGDDFYTGYIPGGKRKHSGIILGVGEDGVTYSGDFPAEDPMVQSYHEGDEVLCPCCWEVGTLTRRGELRNGRTYQVLQAEVQNIEGYTAVLYWTVSRYLDACGGDHVFARPRDALVIGKDGRLQRFTHTTHGQFGESSLGEWRWTNAVREPGMIAYYCWGAINNRQVGTWVYDAMPDLTGTTGEKTALDVYILRGGEWPGLYLQLWQHHRNVENLMRGGFEYAVRSSIKDCADTAIAYGDRRPSPSIGWCSWREVKPYRMVGMTKEEWRSVREKSWGAEMLRLWGLWRDKESGGTAAFEETVKTLGTKGVRDCMEMRAAGWDAFEPQRVAAYLRKQGTDADGVRMLIDYRKLMHEMGLEETGETLWPRSLQEAHDRVVAYKLAHAKEMYQQGFTEAHEKYKALEWNDGELRIVVPRIEEELKREGKVLRHCVGTYGQAHASGSPIFFVRKYRRPERSYYTLNINMKGELPQEVQLHGYGNERHGEYKQHRHGIPRKVREFVDRWEREVLTPWFAEQKQAETRQKKKKRVG